MEEYRIPIPNEDGYYHVAKDGDVEFVNPIELIRKKHIDVTFFLGNDFLISRGFNEPKELTDKILLKVANKQWEEEDFPNIMATAIPEELSSLLNSKSKKEQIKALKGIALTSEQLTTFIIKAYIDYGYTLSEYISEHIPNNLHDKTPEFIHRNEKNEIIFVGETKLSVGQLRQVMEQRKVIVSKFLDKGDNWHCFFLTYKSIEGKENYNNGQPHLHYISNYWGLTRAEVLKQLRSNHYSLPSLPHIDFHTHRNPK